MEKGSNLNNMVQTGYGNASRPPPAAMAWSFFGIIFYLTVVVMVFVPLPYGIMSELCPVKSEVTLLFSLGSFRVPYVMARNSYQLYLIAAKRGDQYSNS